MITKIIDSMFGTTSMRFIKSKQSVLDQINNLEKEIHLLSGEELRDRIHNIKSDIKNKIRTPINCIAEVFAIGREAAIRTIGHRHYDVQILAGLALYEGYIVEMGTGEGKTLVATLPTLMRALEGQVHVVTVNDYLAERDCQVMGKIYEYLGFTVGSCTQQTSYEDKSILFSTKDVIYISNQQIVFYYLSYCLRQSDYINYQGQKIKNKFEQYCAIVDEVDNILIDEAKTPFIMSQPADIQTKQLYEVLNHFVLMLEENNHFNVDFKSHFVALNDNGSIFLEKILQDNNIIHGSLYEAHNSSINHIVNNLLKAHNIYRQDIEYTVMHGEIIIIDENTGRLSFGRRYSSGLHQALEAKEGLEIKDESQTMLSVTYPAFFSGYQVRCGMTGTASTEKEEFLDTYKLKIIQIPPHRTKIRIDNPIRLYKNRELQLKATIDIIKEKHSKGQPILVVTTNVKESEDLEKILIYEGIHHVVLNAKNHRQEAEFIANAGRKGAVTIATNMAGRGTDIKLGGNIDFEIDKLLMLSSEKNEDIHVDEPEIETQEEEIVLEDLRFAEMNLTNLQKKKIKNLLESYVVLKEEVRQLGGLTVITFGMPESEKSLLQAIGRSGRQGDPGESYCMYSIDDDIFTTSLQDSWNRFVFSKIFDEGEEYVSGGPVIGLVRRLWGIITAQNFRRRKELNKYEEVKDEQRVDFFGYRDRVLSEPDIREMFKRAVNMFFEEDYKVYGKDTMQVVLDWEFSGPVELRHKIMEIIEELSDNDLRALMLSSLDWAWKEHINATESVERSSGLISYAQKDPFHEFRKQMSYTFRETVSKYRFCLVEKLFPKEYQDNNNFSNYSDHSINIMEEFKKIQENTKRQFSHEETPIDTESLDQTQHIDSNLVKEMQNMNQEQALEYLMNIMKKFEEEYNIHYDTVDVDDKKNTSASPEDTTAQQEEIILETNQNKHNAEEHKKIQETTIENNQDTKDENGED